MRAISFVLKYISIFIICMSLYIKFLKRYARNYHSVVSRVLMYIFLHETNAIARLHGGKARGFGQQSPGDR